MPLDNAHTGYAYQDRLSVYFILSEILKDSDTTFIFDYKEHNGDRFDDLTIESEVGVYKKQIKHSDTAIEFQKDYLARDSGGYDLGLDGLYQSYLGYKDKDKLRELRICTTWSKPSDSSNIFTYIIEDHSILKSFPDSLIYKININTLWNKTTGIDTSWRNLRKYIDNNDILREDFILFLNKLVIEINLPDFSMNVSDMGKLENAIELTLQKIGVGTFPNDKISEKGALLQLVEFVNRKRSSLNKELGSNVSINEILKNIGIIQSYGSIEQSFPVIDGKNIINTAFSEYLLSIISDSNRIFVKGEPGAGKSWFVENFQKFLNNKSIKFAKHYCYISLEDSLSSTRIKTNTFFGNLINDILLSFPDLKFQKDKLYASDLNELNILLNSINEEFILIIDGLDHINRIAKSDRDLSTSEVDIINNLSKLEFNNNIKLIIFSQPLEETFEGFKTISIPPWTKESIKEYLEKISINYENNFIDLLFDKSKGNALYLNYILSEYKKGTSIETLPIYDLNLKSYYEYLVGGTKINDDVIYALSGLDFRVNEAELNEITNSGDYVKETLQNFSAIINEDFSRGGFIIYHESFRRFIIDMLEQKSIPIHTKIYNPIMEWLEKKGFYHFTKSYRNLLILYIKTGNYIKGLDFVNKDFIHYSLFNGYNIFLIENNHKLLAKCVVEVKNLEKLIYIFENSRILATVLDYEFNKQKYIEALMYVRGFEKVKEYLEFEGDAIEGFLTGLEACYILDINKQNAPWELYFDRFKGEHLDDNQYKKYIKFLTRYALAGRDISLLSKLGKNLIKDRDLVDVFNEEILLFKGESTDNLNFIETISKFRHLRKILNVGQETVLKRIDELTKEIIEKDIFFERDLGVVKDFFGKVNELIKKGDDQKINEIVQELSSRNWFYNWCIYLIKILILQSKTFNFSELRDAFSYLIIDLEPFKGRPRTMDIYGIEPFILNSIDQGLQLIQNNFEDWKEILGILEKVTERTTTYLTNIAGGPLTPSKKLELFKKYLNPINQGLILSSIEEDIKINTKIYSELAENYFDLSIYYGKAGLNEKSNECFNKGLIYSISNGYRKDTTLDELISPMANIYKLDNTKGYDYVKKIEKLSWTVISHTEGGKGIKWLPLNWFTKYVDISTNDATLYLMNELLRSSRGYYWIGEEMLETLLTKINGSINPFVELFIIKTFLNSKYSERFLNYSLNVFEEIVKFDEKIGIGFLSLIIEKSYIKEYGNPRNDSKEFIDRIIRLSGKYKITYNNENQGILHPIHAPNENISLNGFIQSKIGISNINSEMTNAELIEDIIKYEYIPDSKLISLYFIINQRNFDDSLKSLIDTLVLRNFEKFNKYEKKYNTLDLDSLFKIGSEQYFYYKMCIFGYKTGGWFEGFIETSNFIEVGGIDFDKATDYLFDINPEKYYTIGIPTEMSSNLIISIGSIPNKHDLALKMYENLYDIISFRIPDLIEGNFEESLTNNFDMNNEELLVCILISRLRIGSSEISHITISGLTYLLYNYKDLLIKPIKWFFENKDSFLYINKQILLQVLLDFHKEVDSTYVDNFTKQIKDIYPSGEYSVDYIIEQLGI